MTPEEHEQLIHEELLLRITELRQKIYRFEYELLEMNAFKAAWVEQQANGKILDRLSAAFSWAKDLDEQKQIIEKVVAKKWEEI